MISCLCGCSQSDKSMQILTSYSGGYREAVSEDISVYIDDNNLIHMYNVKMKKDAILCNKPDCEHKPYDEKTNSDPVCNAALNADCCVGTIPVLSGEYLYLFAWKGLSKGVIYREKLDGSERKLLGVMDYVVSSVCDVYVENGYAYAEANVPIVYKDKLGGSGANSFYHYIIKVDLATAEAEAISPKPSNPDCEVDLINHIGSKLYYSTYYLDKHKQKMTSVYSYDIKTHEKIVECQPGVLKGFEVVGVKSNAICLTNNESKKKKSEAWELPFGETKPIKKYSCSEKDVCFDVYDGMWLKIDMNPKGKNEFLFEKGPISLNDYAISNAFDKFIVYYSSDHESETLYKNKLVLYRKFS